MGVRAFSDYYNNEFSPVLEAIPATNAAKAGQRFVYKGNQWEYMTAAQIADIGWDVPVGFVAPVSPNGSSALVFIADKYETSTVAGVTILASPSTSYIYNLLGLGYQDKVARIDNLISSSYALIKVIGGETLISLEDVGTASAVFWQNKGMTKAVIDDFFTQLPPTSKTATINVTGNPGAATCDPSIATAKGYTVITS